MSLKTVMNTKGDIITIDSNREKDRMSKYLHRSGVPFDGHDVEMIGKTDEENEEEINIETARKLYEEKFWKKPHPNSKLETLLSKINE